MEGFAALGVAANIAQALEYGFKLLEKSKKLRELGAIDPDLNDDAWRLNKIALSLRSQQLPRIHEDLQNLATECVEVSGELISELKELTPTNPKSKRQRVKAIYKSELRRGRISRLEKRLNDLKPQLNLHLTSIARIECNDKLDEIGQNVRKTTSELAAMQFIMKDLSGSAHIGQEISKTLQSLVRNYHDRFSQSSESAILDKLHFSNMHERFDTILEAHEKTLRWLFEPPTGDHGPKEKARTDFITWLERESGFFHISGKPGAGKSTMMKYICSYEALDNHLKVWCQGARLGRGQFFFWLPGTAEQKSLKGLLRGLLYSILGNHRDLIPIAFPDLWELMLSHSSSRKLEYRDFQEGFVNILKYASQSRLYKFVLFIDGLDEFEGRHLELINTIKEWTTKYSTVLKICVSSREYMAFQESFMCCPKICLHECTYTDIERMVSAHLKSKQQFVDLFTSDQSQTIIELITARAEGVFLWVSIVLADIEDSIINGASLSELKENIEAYPTELDPLYQHLVNLIRLRDRRWAFRTLKMVQFFQSPITVEYGRLWYLSLLQLSFLESMQDDGATIAAAMEASTLEQMTAAQRLDNTYKKVYGRCKGFLHIQDSSDPTFDIPPTMKQQVIFIHRSIVEFLETPSFVEIAQPYTHDFDCFDNAYHALAKCIEYQQLIPDILRARKLQPREFILSFWQSNITNYSLVGHRLRPFASWKPLPYFEAFRERILTLVGRYEERHALSESINQFFAECALDLCVSRPLETIEYRDRRLDPPYDSSYVLAIYVDFYEICVGKRWSSVTLEEFIKILNRFLFVELDLNDSRLKGDSPWKSIILDFMKGRVPQGWCPAELIDRYLRRGADPDMIVGQFIPHGPRSVHWLNPEEGWQFFWPHLETYSSSDIAFDKMADGHLMFAMNETAHFCQYVKENGGVLKVQDLLSYWFPDNEYFPNLIHAIRPAKDGGNSDPTPLPNEAEMPRGQVIRRLWETDYAVYSTSDIEKALESAGLTPRELDNQLKLPASKSSNDM
ncbi:hypothetical protein GGR58DRAFT_331149 [Xylaria digitata]|nr:hypothetical protein GGR58DRAFT_331149 [Xylaria digitata]